MYASDKSLKLIMNFEGFRANPYLDAVGVPTIGYGTTVYPDGKRVTMDDAKISRTQALNFLLRHVIKDENSVNGLVTAPLTQGQFDALVSFTYNLGVANLRSSTLLRKLNRRDYEGAAQEFDRWVYASGQKLNGLIRRREAERKLFENGG